MENNPLIEYIRSQRQLGRDDNEIWNSLAPHGWTDEEIGEAFNQVDNQKLTTNFNVKFLWGAIILLIVIILFLLGYLIFPKNEINEFNKIEKEILNEPSSNKGELNKVNIKDEQLEINEQLKSKNEQNDIQSKAGNISYYSPALSPGRVDVGTILKGTVQERSFNFVRSHPEFSGRYKVTVRGDYSHYIEGPEYLELEYGEEITPYIFKINPKDASLGEYKIDILFTPDFDFGATSDSDGTTGTKIKPGIVGRVDFIVSGEEKVEYKISDIRVTDTEVNNDIDITYSIKNTGNVDWKPDKVEYIFFQNQNQSSIHSQSSDEIPLTKPGQNQKINTYFAHNLTAEKYQIKANFYYKNKIVYETLLVDFEVYPKDTLKQKGVLYGLETNKDVYKPDELIKINGIFENIGEIPLKVKLFVEIYNRDTLTEALESKELQFSLHEKLSIPLILHLSEEDEYKIVAYAEYGNKVSDKHEKNILISKQDINEIENANIEKSKSALVKLYQNNYILILILFILSIGIIILLVYLILRKIK